MHCKNCGEKLSKEANVCPKCGTKRGAGNKFCFKCGSKLVAGKSFCSNCGTQVIKTTRRTPTSVSPNNIPPLPTKQPENKEFILKNINTVLAIASIILLLLPMLTLNAYEAGYSNRLSISGYELATGVTFTDNSEMDGSVFAWLMVIIPIVSIFSNHVKKLMPIKKSMLFLAPLANAICLFLAKSAADSSANVSLSTASGFWIYLIVCAFWFIIGILQYKDLPLKTESLKSLLSDFVKTGIHKHLSESPTLELPDLYFVDCSNAGEIYRIR